LKSNLGASVVKGNDGAKQITRARLDQRDSRRDGNRVRADRGIDRVAAIAAFTLVGTGLSSTPSSIANQL
jgi:hypothetical protein